MILLFLLLLFLKHGDTALMFAASRGHKEIVELLVKSNADVNVKDIVR